MALSPRKEKAIDTANKIYEANVSFIRRRASALNKSVDTDPVVQQSIASYGSLRDETIRQIKHPPKKPASTEPTHRVVGFKIDPQP